MKFEITINENDVAVVWSVDDSNVQSIADIREGASRLFKLPKKSSAVGKTGAQIRWAAYPEAVITADYRFDSEEVI